ncbi:GTPase HflX [Spirochaetia bacterium]|nr:GTPase HflX [Spirochaetia bacterium]
MNTTQETKELPKRAFLVSVYDGSIKEAEAAALSREFTGLTATLGLEIAAQEAVHIREHTAKYAMGTGKAAELAERAKEAGADCIIFNGDLSPSQQRNWEELSGIAAIDRQELIIQIFASRAQTKEAVLQVSLAQLTYSLPRLSHKYIDLARQRGGRYGSKGKGETRLETDRRLVQERIHRLKRELRTVKKQRDVQRKQRERQGIPLVAIVGYTNAGKSSLLKALTGADVFIEDKLFATLDPVTRRIMNPDGLTYLLTDTVGFIRRLPHALVNAFHSTLEEAALSDLLLHVLDATDPDIEACYQTTRKVLAELGAQEVPSLVVLNKVDKITGSEQEALVRQYPGSLCASAMEKQGLDALKTLIGQRLLELRV